MLDVRVPLRDLVGRRVTLSYQPASVDDHRLSAAFGGLDSVPAYLLRVRPVLKVDGRTVATGEAMDMGVSHPVDLDLIGAWGTERVSQTLLSGAYTAVALGGPRVATFEDEEHAADTEGLAARVLSQLALRYGRAWDGAEDELARWLGMSVMRPVPSVTFVGHSLRVRTVAGLPTDLDWQGVHMDAALRVAEPVHGHGPFDAEAWRRLAALQGSALEHGILEEYLLVESLSADKGLGIARDLGIEVHSMHPGDDVSSLDLSVDVRESVEALLAAGYDVHVPAGEFTLNDWTGAVWHGRDPVTGAEGYFLAGGLAGGMTTVAPSGWDPDVAEELESPYSEPPNKDPLAAELIEPVWESYGQYGTVDQVFDLPMGVVVLDGQGRAVQGATVTFTLETGGGQLRSGSRRGNRLEVKSDSRGRAVVQLKSGRETADQPAYLRRTVDDVYAFKVLQNQLKASVETHRGALDLSRPLVAFGFPGPVTSVERTNKDPRYSNNEYFDSFMGLWSDTMEFTATDAFGNPVANQGVTAFHDGIWAGYVDIPVGNTSQTLSCWVPDEEGIAKATFFDAFVGPDGFPGECSSMVPKTGECGKTLKTVLSRSDGRALVGVIPGGSWVQYNVGTRRAHDADAACEARLATGDADARFEQVCADLYQATDEAPKLSTEDYYYTFIVIIETTYNPLYHNNPCLVGGANLVEGWDAHAATGIGEDMAFPATVAKYGLGPADCEATGRTRLPRSTPADR